MRYIWAAATHQGMARANNEDSVFPETSGESSGPAILMVADGMGGHIAGEVASRLAVNTAASSDLPPADRVAAANRSIREQVARQPDLEGMATTLTLVELTPDGKAHFGHIGDSRAYLFRAGKLRQLTADHTVVAQYVAAGTLSPEEAADHPHSHMLTRCLGLTRFVNVDEIELPLDPGDRLLLCSDGLTLMVTDDEIAANLATESADETVWALIEEANQAGGQDNITVIIADVLAGANDT
ncbi:MAG TPA: protein phosphatase 2C domain-containing protein [Acidimicrobiia bacterium]|nr:protein phosphatase 2C domain-containing protein [Acidimicrobiia bacterium]